MRGMDDDLDQQLALSASLVEQRMQMGDRAEVPREVDHLAYFTSKRQAQAAVRDLEAARFKVSGTRRRLLRSAVEFSRTDVVDQESAAAFTREIVTIVTTHGGTYDGWGAMLVQ